MRESLYNSDSVDASGDGTFDRSVWYQDVDAGESQAGVVVVTFGNGYGALPYPDLTGLGLTDGYPYVVTFELLAAGDSPVIITSPANTGKPVDGATLQFNSAIAPAATAGRIRVMITRQIDQI
jgi:hypothetical protein